MPEFHVHVYRVRGMLEMKIEAVSPAEAGKKAIERISENPIMRPADRDFVARVFNYYESPDPEPE